MKMERVRRFVLGFKKDEKGEGYIDVLIKILITVVIGTLLLKLLQVAIPDLFEKIITKVSSMLSI